MALDDEQKKLLARSRPLRGPVHRRKPRPEGEGGDGDDDQAIDEGPSPDDVERFADVTVRCKECGTELFDDVQMCYQCGRAVMGEDRTKRLPPWVLVIIVLIAIVTLYQVLLAPMWGPLLWRPKPMP